MTTCVWQPSDLQHALLMDAVNDEMLFQIDLLIHETLTCQVHPVLFELEHVVHMEPPLNDYLLPSHVGLYKIHDVGYDSTC